MMYLKKISAVDLSELEIKIDQWLRDTQQRPRWIFEIHHVISFTTKINRDDRYESVETPLYHQFIYYSKRWNGTMPPIRRTRRKKE